MEEIDPPRKELRNPICVADVARHVENSAFVLRLLRREFVIGAWFLCVRGMPGLDGPGPVSKRG